MPAGSHASQSFSTAALIAYQLGIIPAAHGEYLAVTEEERFILVFESLLEVQRLDNSRRHQFLDELAANYLENLILIFLNPPPVDVRSGHALFGPHHVYLQVLSEMAGTRYFANYMMTPRKEDTKVKLFIKAYEALKAIATGDPVPLPAREDPFKLVCRVTCNLLFRLFACRIDMMPYFAEYVHRDPSEALVVENTLKRIQTIFRDDQVAWVATILLGLSQRDPAAYHATRLEFKDRYAWYTCARSGCNVNRYLYLCSRCVTVVYCSREHQREHWLEEDGHKAHCFEDPYHIHGRRQETESDPIPVTSPNAH